MKTTKTIFLAFSSLIFISLFSRTVVSQSWSPLGSGVSAENPNNAYVFALAVYRDEVVVGGTFTIAGGVNVNYIAKWNGTSWSPLGSGVTGGPAPGIDVLFVYNDELIVAGGFTTAGGIPVRGLAKWNGSSWATFGGGGFNGRVYDFTLYGGELIACGDFTKASGLNGGVYANRIARWNGTSWATLGSGMDWQVNALTVYNSELIAGGYFTTAGGISANRIAKWNGNTWSPLGSGMDNGVSALTVYGGELIAGGYFQHAGGDWAFHIARWNGSSWATLGDGVSNNVFELIVYGGELIVGGTFTSAGGINANYIAKWNGTSWAPLGSGMGGGAWGETYVSNMVVYGTDLFAGGNFTTAGGVSANKIARWSDNVGIHTINEKIPGEYKLYQNYPNPFNPSTNIRFDITKTSLTSIKIYDNLGREISTLVNEQLQSGEYEIAWDASGYSSGMYFYKLETAGYTETKKMMLVK